MLQMLQERYFTLLQHHQEARILPVKQHLRHSLDMSQRTCLPCMSSWVDLQQFLTDLRQGSCLCLYAPSLWV